MAENYTQFSDATRKAQEPFRALMELNLKTIQSLSYLRPEELADVKKPEDLMEKQVELVLNNGHKMLNYMERTFDIYEKAIRSCLQETKIKPKKYDQH